MPARARAHVRGSPLAGIIFWRRGCGSMPRSHIIEWLRLPGDLVFIFLSAVPLVIATFKGWLGVRADAAAERR